MKIAIVHDWLVTNAGAEKVLRAIVDIYPDADIFSLVDFLNDKDRADVLNNKFAKSSFIQKLPFAKKHFRNYLPLFPRAIESFDLSEYDLIISSSWAVAKGVKKRKNQVHISYCYTPIRYAWDLYDEYTSNLKQPKKFLVQQTLRYIKQWDIQTLRRVDFFIADSKFVQNRIKKTYDRDSVVIYPPVDTDKFTLKEKKDDFYFTASRLVSYKKTKLIVEAFNKMPNRALIVIGSGEEYDSIKAIAKDNITLLGYQEDEILIKHMQRAKAFVYAAIEDFGIVPIEAMSCGTPVIALNDGGTAETVIDGITGVHFEKQTPEDIIKAVNLFESLQLDSKKISHHVKTYSTDRFKDELRTFVNSKVKI
ncbi:Glycosyl transferase, group 1 [Sulfurimonas denitrificans DSM 1251]|uniref:Glycosyl transferase, group 1 n=1 Tax=Sulfurimonas denitrificans (strain ATCC 33889 / DSM 1251) TaxID=326298 RepID=Q30PV4_SULDN|nr:glycosyltransferase [Sulfurimonas denitrificans]ABB44977.1 Glycosyl transferase, group 1 [Sulfurimonas denitrificans DSM 1251]MDD3443577.1 glycosyltransferase [Sulfurimonas denitrificans]